LKAKYPRRLTQTDIDKLTQGGQFMTEKEGGSDVGTLTKGGAGRRPLAAHRRKMVLLQCRRQGRDAAGAAEGAGPARAASGCS
jgi:hypothetical protein